MSDAQLALFEATAHRDRIIARFQENHKEYLEAVRAFARDYCRVHREVAIDDVREVLKRYDFPLPSDMEMDDRILAAVFKTKEFLPIGRRETHRALRIARAGKNASIVTVYKLRAA